MLTKFLLYSSGKRKFYYVEWINFSVSSLSVMRLVGKKVGYFLHKTKAARI